MRQKKAKLLRKLVYKEEDYRDRRYHTTKKGVIYNVGQPIKIGKQNLSLRRIYQHLKKKVQTRTAKEMKKSLLE